ncbi:MAG: tetratricopeptide repeat protein [Bacteroidales bacterium]|nr:tetratricopeptide repeat protein [Bacteroidales bacterium]
MRKKTKIFAKIGIGLLVIAVLTGCSTSKNTLPNRVFHNVTCKYNVYWNGNQAMKDAEKEYAKLSKDNYTATLPIYNYPDKSELGPCLSHLDRTIEKCSKAIHKHSMLIKGKEYVKTIDDAYFLMAKSYFYKQDYVQAQRVLNYIAHTYPKSNIRNEAEVLLARTQIRQGYYSSADELLETIRYMNENKNKKKFAVLFNAAKAEYHLTAPDGDVQEAIDYIGNALDNKPKKEFRTRLQLILGELYENLGQQAEAQKNFKTVIKQSSNYEMTFCAQMHLAANYDGTESNRNAITKQLNKMLDDKKNENYRDQIYYALSEIARIDEDQDLRIDYLAKSVAASTENNYQKTFSSIALADLYFEQNDYREAQHYYDTAMMSIPKNYPNYEQLQKKSNVLKDLVDKLDEIDLQDSLLRIANLPEAQRNAWVKKMIADYTEAERKAAEEEAERMLAMQNAASYSNINNNMNSSNGKWYFYNQSLVTAGQQDFYRRFGNRKLEDNWFISNKTQISFDDMALLNDPSLVRDTVEYDEDGNPIATRETDPKKEAYYLQDLPLRQGAKDTANAIIAKDLYETGFMYQDLLNDTKRACASFESLIQRYPKSEYTLPAIYMLYTLYRNAGDAKADSYRNILLTQHAETDYAKLIQDPDYYNKLAAKEKVLENRYSQVYEDFSNKRWRNVVTAADEAIPNCTDLELKSQYAYLRTVAAGQVYNQDTLIVGLTKIVSQYSKYPVAELARIYLSNFSKEEIQKSLGIENHENKEEILEQVTQNTSTKKESIFEFNASEQHYVVLLVKTAEMPLQTAKQDLTNFNSTFFSLKKLSISSFLIDNKRQMITVTKFDNGDDAMDYYNILVKNEVFEPEIDSGIIEVYAMSATNYTSFYNKRDSRNSYPEFFKDNYLNNQ